MNQPSDLDTLLDNPEVNPGQVNPGQVNPGQVNPGVDASTEGNAAAIPGAIPAAVPVAKPQPSYVKLAMRNMVRKRGTSIYHFALTTIGLLAVLVGLAYLTR